MAPIGLRTGALMLAGLFTAFWLWFGIASAIGEGLDLVGGFMHTLLPGGLLLVTVLAAWKWEALGGLLLVAEGLIVAVGYPLTFGRRFPIATVLMVLLTMSAPFVISGCMLLIDARRAAWRA